MTTTPTASPELPDLDKLEALARAATPGEWIEKPHGRIVGGPLRHYINGSTQAQIASFSVTYHEHAPDDEPERQQANTAFCAAAHPSAVLALIALARRAQPEGEAPQVEPVTKVACPSCNGIGTWIGQHNGYDDADCHMCDGAGKVAATLSPLCGAQHAESVPARHIELIGCIAQMADQLRAVSPLNMALDRADAILAAQQAAGPGSLDEARELLKTARDDCGLGSELGGKVDDFLERSAGAPGTPEAPKTARPKRLTEEEVRELALQHLHDDTESAGRNGFFTFSAEGLDGFAIDLMDSQHVAQLDGGQEGSES